jgi:murein DD-endopeptidase MepM/ murein hydrolase activator NlpD
MHNANGSKETNQQDRIPAIIDETLKSSEIEALSADQPVATRRESRFLRIAVNLLMVFVLAILGILIWQRFMQSSAQAVSAPTASTATLAPTFTPLAENLQAAMQPISLPTDSSVQEGILKHIDSHTIIPERPSEEVITYTVQRDDTLFGIADSFGLKPETILWGNFETLQDNPHLLKPDQVLNILPIDGTYYKWNNNDNLGAVAAFFGADPQAVLEFPGNKVDLTEVDGVNSGFQPDQWIVIPGGKRAIKDWGPPAITRKNAAAASYYGDGSCGAIYEGAVGTGTFIWPTVVRSISGYNYSGIHPAIDIAGATGNAVFASDSGVVVFAGWSNYGYGYLIVIDHGNGYQTAYAHLSAINVGCGQSVFQGSTIGAVGNTGNSAGSHLHFELSYGGAKLNPLENLR